jgi:hypothetical protein
MTISTITDLHGHIEFAAALGLAIADWVGVETVLCRVFIEFVDARNRTAANAAFNAIQTFTGKLAMAHAAAKVHLRDDQALKDRFKEWGAFRNRIMKASEKRNDFAHHTILFEARDAGIRVPFLVPNIADETYRKERFSRPSEREDAYSLADIRSAHKEFNALANQLEAWRRRYLSK